METGVQKRNIVLIFVCLAVLGFLICIASLGSVSAGPTDPNFYYYSSGRKYALTLSTEKLAVRFKQGLTIEEQKALVESEPDLGLFYQRGESATLRLIILPLSEGLTEENVIETLKTLNARQKIEVAYPIFDLPNSKIVLTDEFIVKFAPDVSKSEIDAFNTLNGVEIARKIERIQHYILRVKAPQNMNTLKIANLYYENPITIFSVPNFIGRTKDAPTIPNDKYFDEDKQWPLDNWGQVPPGGTNGADIDGPEGWGISTGSSDIVIAVLDTGVDLAHEDLVNKLVDGYDAYAVPPDNDPSPGDHPDNAHGTACAGLAAAQTNNTIGIAGVSWNCKLMPIRVMYVDDNGDWDYPRARLAAGIAWAADNDNGADVLSCSWPEIEDNDAVHDAIIDAKNNGREGRGCVLVFAVHNYNRPLTFPSAYPEVIAVGATDHHDDRWDIGFLDGSNFGPELDVVAPSGWGGQGVIMWTTDISGNAGYNPNKFPEDPGDAAGHYWKWFGGTSAATPEVAGLAGLILSVNPDLTADEVQFIIESTADDQIGDPLEEEDTEGWDQYYGWGRINNEGALLKAGSFSIDDTLFGWWKFDEGEETIAHDSAGDNNGTLADSPHDPAWVDDPVRGWCLDFDGDDYVELDHAVDALKAGAVTISAWIRRDETESTYLPIVSTYYREEGNHYGYLLYVKNTAQPWQDPIYEPIFYLAPEKAESGVSINTVDWFHLAGTYDGSDLKIYVDGELKDTNPESGLTGYYEPYDDTYIGYEDNISEPGEPPSVYFDGKIDDVRVYRRALSIFEIWDAMSGDAPRFRVKDSSGETVAWFDSFGNLFLKGIFEPNTTPEASANDEFRFQDSNSNDVAIIDANSGNMYIEGLLQAQWQDPNGQNDEFIIEDSNDQPVSYINDSGDVFLKGRLYDDIWP